MTSCWPSAVRSPRDLDGCRQRVGELSAQLGALTDTVHRDEVARAQAALRIEQLEESITEQLGIGLDDLVAEYGPDVPLPPSALEIAEYEQARERGEQVTMPQPVPYDRASQERRAKQAQRDLNTLGKVNPLALEEFAALEERYNFLSTQLEDVKNARKDLLDVVAEVDARILQVFTEAYADVEREFVEVFQTLFPGGEGRLLLTDPSDMLTTGIEVEARPPGKKVKRLSLLSGGEKSLTAVALLVAIFRARPSPFYVMDEVEAALDDTNLRRLIGLFEQLRERSQLIVITHQKPTMEVADALYGVSMRGDGITTVISQRLRGSDLAVAPASDAGSATDPPRPSVITNSWPPTRRFERPYGRDHRRLAREPSAPPTAGRRCRRGRRRRCGASPPARRPRGRVHGWRRAPPVPRRRRRTPAATAATTHQRSPGVSPGKPNSGRGVPRSLPTLAWKARNSVVTTVQMVWLPRSSGPLVQQPSR